MAADLETTGKDFMRDEITHISFANKEVCCIYDFGKIKSKLPYLASKKLIFHNGKFDLHFLSRYMDISNLKVHDTMVMAGLHDSQKRKGLEFTARDLLGVQVHSITSIMKEQKTKVVKDIVVGESEAKKLTGHAYASFLLFENLKEEIREKFSEVYSLELRLIPVLIHMEASGIKVNVEYLEELENSVAIQRDRMFQQVTKDTGGININSSVQLGKFLYETLGIECPLKTESGAYSVKEEALKKIEHPVVNTILLYRKLEKLRSTFLPEIRNSLDSKNRIHSSFNSFGAVTGRFSSSNPNLQNVPLKKEKESYSFDPEGVLSTYDLRKLFVPEKGLLLGSGDYSQIEYRIFVDYMNDPRIIKLYKDFDFDYHTYVGERLPLKDKTPEQRRKIGKTINFGIIYGMGSGALARKLGVTRAVADAFMGFYFSELPLAKQFRDLTIEEVERHGYIVNRFGKRVYVPQGYMGVNYKVQGDAAYLVKWAMIEVYENIIKKNSTKMILNIHDELLFEGLDEKLGQQIKGIMEGCYKLKVPLKVDWGITDKHWGELK